MPKTDQAIKETEHSTEYIKFTFTENEKREIASEMARKVAELNSAEDERKAVASSLKSRIDSLQAQVNDAANKLNNGYEYRNVKCEVDRDFKEKTIYFIFDGETVKEKPMSADDLQPNLGKGF